MSSESFSRRSTLTRRGSSALGVGLIFLILTACQPQIIEVDRPVTRVVEKVVERVVTRIVVETIDVVEVQTPDVTPSDSATPVSTSRNLAPSGSAFVSSGEDSAQQAIDDDIESAWNSQLFPI